MKVLLAFVLFFVISWGFWVGIVPVVFSDVVAAFPIHPVPEDYMEPMTVDSISLTITTSDEALTTSTLRVYNYFTGGDVDKELAIRQWAEDGSICAVLGHSWITDYSTQTSALGFYEKCYICKRHEFHPANFYVSPTNGMMLHE